MALRKQRILEIEREGTRSHVWSIPFGRGCGPVIRQTGYETYFIISSRLHIIA
jgi:hypothetical protein